MSCCVSKAVSADYDHNTVPPMGVCLMHGYNFDAHVARLSGVFGSLRSLTLSSPQTNMVGVPLGRKPI